MLKSTKTRNVIALILVVSLVVLGVAAAAYRQSQSKKTTSSVVHLQNKPLITNQVDKHQEDFIIKEWGVSFKIPVEYKDNLYYQISALHYEQQPTGNMPSAGQYISFSFKSIVADYQTCAPSYQKVAILHRHPVGQSRQLISNDLTPFKTIGGFEYSYKLPRDACIEGSFPYHENQRNLYDQFRASFPKLVSQLRLIN